jgi:Tfp pilus assembly protein PilP
LKSRGVEFASDVTEESYGFITQFKAPGDFQIQLYQPKYVRKPAVKPAAARVVKPNGKRKPKPKAKPKAKAKRKMKVKMKARRR